MRWINIIYDLIKAYNISRHRFIGMSPTDVKKRLKPFWVRLLREGDSYLKPSFPQGAMVRASKHKTIFDKGHMPNWTKEHYTVSQAESPKTVTMRRLYKLVTTTMQLWKAASTQRRFRKFQTINTA